MANIFKDFIPAGEPTGGQGSGFADYVPAPDVVKEVPKPVIEPTVEEEKPVQMPPKVIKKYSRPKK